MICPSCKKSISDNSSFCQHCGSKIPSRSSSSRAKEWEHKDFVYEFPEGNWRQNLSDPEARHAFWEYHQSTILSRFQEWVDEGWQAISEVGPAGITLRKKKVLNLDFLEYVLVAVSLGLYLLIAYRSTRIFPVEFRVKMRRPK